MLYLILAHGNMGSASELRIGTGSRVRSKRTRAQVCRQLVELDMRTNRVSTRLSGLSPIWYYYLPATRFYSNENNVSASIRT